MFSSDLIFRGKHGYYIKELVQEHKVFNRNLDVFLTAPFIGYHFNKKEEIDSSTEYGEIDRTINLSQMISHRDEINMLYRLMMLLEDSSNLSSEQRIDRAFKEDVDPNLAAKHQKNLDLFFSYVRGGISTLYEKLIKDTTSKADRYERVKEFVNDYTLDHSDNIEEKNKEIMF